MSDPIEGHSAAAEQAQNCDIIEGMALDSEGHHGAKGSLMTLGVGAIGVVFGDIGTSPLYAIQAIMTGEHKLPIDLLNIYGVISLIFWTMVIVVTAKYVFIVMRCDNNGEGGSLALLALINRKLPDTRGMGLLVAGGLLATALFYADSMLTPAISVISAVEGLDVVSTSFHAYIVPIALVILVGLFMIQARGTEKVGKMFGPVMVIWFGVIAAMGLWNIRLHPQVLWEPLNPYYIWLFFRAHPFISFLSLSAVVYSITGVEALYADMGHFGRRAITYAWLVITFPALVINYMGQAALLITTPSAASNPFFNMVPDQLQLPLVILATLATVIASQAVISGAFSVTQQAIQLGYLPRIRIKHTSHDMAGQIYVPSINWFLACMVAALVVSFKSSAAMLPAYGLAVVGTMFITTGMLAVVMLRLWKMAWWKSAALLAFFLAVDTAYLAAGSAKFFDGAWFPVVVGVIIFLMLTTWAKGRALMSESMAEGALPIELFARSAHSSATRVPGTAVFMTSSVEGVPSALLHNIKHNKVLHERVVILTVIIKEMPYVAEIHRVSVSEVGQGFFKVALRFGFLEETDVPQALKGVMVGGEPFDMMKTSFFLSRQTLIASAKPGMAIWREKLFAWMMRNAASAMEFFRLPVNRVVELGSQVEI
jgi:KUP system potassium uptake protein